MKEQIEFLIEIEKANWESIKFLMNKVELIKNQDKCTNRIKENLAVLLYYQIEIYENLKKIKSKLK